jgi:hypothetical protein
VLLNDWSLGSDVPSAPKLVYRMGEDPMRQIAEFCAGLSCSLFAGAAVYISLVGHPARMECGLEIAATEFSPSYRRASGMQATLAAVCLLSSIAAWFAGAMLTGAPPQGEPQQVIAAEMGSRAGKC